MEKKAMNLNNKGLSVDKVKSMMFSINRGNYSLPAIFENKASGGFLTYGDDNAYPQYLLNLYNNSSTHHGLIVDKVYYTCGKGLYSKSGDSGLEAFIKSCNRYGDSLDDVFRKCVLDYEIFGGFALQVTYTKLGGEIAEINYVNLANYRWDINMNHLKYARNWGARGIKVKTIEYDVYNDTEESGKTGTKIFYYNGDSRDQYPVPEYIGALAAIETEVEYQHFGLNSIKNGFFPSLAITYKNGIPETEEEKDTIEQQLNDKFGGSSNTGKVMVNFCDADQPSPDIVPIAQPELDKMFIQLREISKESIFNGHRISAPVIFGTLVTGKLGNTNEFNQGLGIFMVQYVEPNRTKLLRIFNRILSTNFPEADLLIKNISRPDTLFVNEALIMNHMTQEEIRIKLKDEGYIADIAIPEGQKTISETMKPPIASVSVTSEPVADPNEILNQ